MKIKNKKLEDNIPSPFKNVLLWENKDEKTKKEPKPKVKILAVVLS